LLGNKELDSCKVLVYLGGAVSEDDTCDTDIARRVKQAAGTVRSLDKI